MQEERIDAVVSQEPLTLAWLPFKKNRQLCNKKARRLAKSKLPAVAYLRPIQKVEPPPASALAVEKDYGCITSPFVVINGFFGKGLTPRQKKSGLRRWMLERGLLPKHWEISTDGFIPRPIPSELIELAGEDFAKRVVEAVAKIEPFTKETLREFSGAPEVSGSDAYIDVEDEDVD